MKRPNSTPPIEVVSIEKIDAGETPKAKREIEALKNDFREHGQLVAIVLAKIDGDTRQIYRLLSGRKRLEAAKLLNWKEIKAVVIPAELDAADAMLDDWVEYIEKHQRFEMDHYALAKAAIHMEERWKVKGSDFAHRLGFSGGYIYNLMRWYRDVPPEVREAWRKGSPLINQAELERYSHMPKDEAVAAWETRCRMRTAAFEPFTPGKKKKAALPLPTNGEDKPTKLRRASEQEIMRLQQAIDDAPILPPVKHLATNILRYVLGIDKNVRGVTTFHIDLPPEIVDKNAVKAREKEAREASRAAL